MPQGKQWDGMGRRQEEEQAPPRQYLNEVEFAEHLLFYLFRRNLDSPNIFWCSEWWRHPEAYFVIRNLWRAYEDAFQKDDPGGLLTWYLGNAKTAMAGIMSETGPFKSCNPSRHKTLTEEEMHLPFKRLPWDEA